MKKAVVVAIAVLSLYAQEDNLKQKVEDIEAKYKPYLVYTKQDKQIKNLDIEHKELTKQNQNLKKDFEKIQNEMGGKK